MKQKLIHQLEFIEDRWENIARCLIFSDYEVQKRICEKVIEAFHSSMHSSQTQVAMIFYGRRVYENDGYMSSYSAALDYLKQRQKENEQGTRTDLALEATKQLIQDSSR